MSTPASNLPLALTTGEPAGIGPLISLRAALAWQFTHDDQALILIGSIAHLNLVAEQFGVNALCVDAGEYSLSTWRSLPSEVRRRTLRIHHCPLTTPAFLGQLNSDNAAYVLATLDAALNGIAQGLYSGMVTAPVHKEVINQAGIAFTGHTEYLQQFAATPRVVMMLADGATPTHIDAQPQAKPLRVALATTHLPLAKVPAAITVDGLIATLTIVHHDLRRYFGVSQPRILVAGLNPHAGEGGYMGREEIDCINPAIARCQQQGMDIRGCYPADTLFQPHLLQDADAVLAMYHDQGLPVLKYATFGQGVNITLGLPFVRTSVDHGTALDRATTGEADHGSLLAALHTAAQMVRHIASAPHPDHIPQLNSDR